MKNLVLLTIAVATLSLITLNCTTPAKSGQLTFDEIQSDDFAIHDSTLTFYESFCKDIIESTVQDKKSIVMLNRGFLFDVAIEGEQLTFENKVKDKYHWWFKGQGQFRDEEFELKYTVSSPVKHSA